MEKFSSVVEKQFFVPPLDRLCQVLEEGLKQNFENVSVSVVECPDLTQEPYSLAEKGLCGKTAITDVGGVNNMHYLVNNKKYMWDISDIAERINMPNALVIGAAASSYDCSAIKDNSEIMPNTLIGGHCLTKEAYIDKDNVPKLSDYNSNKFGCLGNLYFSEGKPGQVIRIRVEKRTGTKNFVNCMREKLTESFTEQMVGIGGVFVVSSGKIKSHIMPSFPSENLDNQQQVDQWLKFFHIDAPVTCLSVFVNRDNENLALRLEHTHFFTNRDDGGHYHYDITPDEVVYEGYFCPAQLLYRIDRSYPPQ
jgi:hypothetical protein